MLEVTRFWLEEIGVDGFRLDAIKHLIEQGRVQENTPQTHDWLADFYRFYKNVAPDSFTVGEAWTSTEQILDYTGDEVDIAFQFDLAEKMIAASEFGIASLVQNEIKEIVESYPPGQYATFLSNHDQNRSMSQLKEHEDAAKVAAALLLTSPGVPFLYYGEEIGMTGTKPDEQIRRPMQWRGGDDKVGFSEGRPWQEPALDFRERNVLDQEANPDSLLNHYRRLIHLRNQHEALRVGKWLPVESDNRKLYTFLRQSENETLLVLINLDDEPIEEYQLTLSDFALVDTSIDISENPTVVFGDGQATAPILNLDGGFSGYTPVSIIDSHSVVVIQFGQGIQ